jgi:pimeloyl-ACP methyl ester carboxylesterase
MSESAEQLHFTSVGDPASARQRIVMLHGIYGRGRNWQAIAREVCGARQDWSALLVDLRLHGESPAFAPPHTLQTAAGDVERLMASVAQDGGPPVTAVLGHSYGGKVTLALAASAAAPGTLRQIWVVDATPATHPARGSAWKMLNDVRSLPSTFTARADAVSALEGLGWPTGVASWMATNLRFADGQFRWTLDFDAMESLMHSYFTTDLWSIVDAPPAGLDIHFIKATGSNTINEEACERIERAAAEPASDTRGRVHLHRVEGTHWLNADNPAAIVALLKEHLPKAGGLVSG